MFKRFSTQRSKLAVSFLAGVFLIGPTTALHAEQLQHVPGTSVSLVPIEGFSPSPEMAGFTSKDGGAILITEMPPEVYDEIYRAAENPGKELVPMLAAQGMTLEKVEELPTSSGAKVPFFTTRQGPFDKWMGLFKGEKTVWVIVQSDRSADREALVKQMMSVKIGTPASREEEFDALPFTVQPAAPFRLTNLVSGVSVSLTVGDKDVDPNNVQPRIAVSYELQRMPSQSDLDRFAEAHLTDPSRYVSARIETKKTGRLAGYEATVLIGRYDGEVGRTPHAKRFIMYLAIAASGRTIVLSMTADETEFDKLTSAADEIARSVLIKPER